MPLPPACCRPASIFSHSVESNMSGSLMLVTRREASSCMSFSPLRPTKSTLTSRMCAPSRSCSLAKEQEREGAHILDVNVDFVGRNGEADMHELASRLVINGRLLLVCNPPARLKQEARL